MFETYENCDFRLDEDAAWLLKNWPPDTDWGIGWTRDSRISRQHFPPTFLNDYARLIITGRCGNARAEIERLTDLADWMSITVVGVAVSDDDESFVLIFDTCVPDWDAADPGREALTDFMRAAWLTKKYGLEPGYIQLRMLFEGSSVLDEWGPQQIPKAWS